jgi:hypothetical protein
MCDSQGGIVQLSTEIWAWSPDIHTRVMLNWALGHQVFTEWLNGMHGAISPAVDFHLAD